MIKTHLTTEKRLKRRSYIKYRWDSKIHDHNREAFRFIKDKDISPQVTSIVEKMESELHPCGRKMDGYWTYQTMANHDPTDFAANSTIRCKANLQPEPTYLYHTLNILVCGYMNGDLPNQLLFSLSGRNSTLETSKCFLS